MKLVCLILIAVFVFNTLLAESATSLTICGVILLITMYFKFQNLFKQKYHVVYNLIFALLGVSALIYITIASSSQKIFSSFTGSLGKDSTLTGRTELWGMAIDAISEKPLLGWGYDSHISVMSDPTYDVIYNHYHNGYLDTLIAGGPILLLLLIYNFFRHGIGVLTAMKKHFSAFMLVIPLVMVLLYNLSEYSIMRPNSAMWILYMSSFSAAFFASQSVSGKDTLRKPTFKSKPKSKEKRHRFG